MPIQTVVQLFSKVHLSQQSKGIIFHFGLPVTLALVAATRPGYTSVFGLGYSILYMGLITLIPWWIAELSTRAAWWIAGPLTLPLWVLCGLGILSGTFIVYPYVIMITSVFVERWPDASSANILISGPQNVTDFAIQSLHAMFYWILANYAFDRLLNYPRFRYEDENSKSNEFNESSLAENSLRKTKLLKKSERFKSLSEITVMKAEEHYVQLFSELQEELVSLRFGIAILDLAQEDGFRVHRSYWVRKSFVDYAIERSGRLELVLKDGQVIPVSKQYHGLVRQIFEISGGPE
ncbi:MAG: LytTR family DNA-binding domain-containing protein [Pseudomonadota bacterium]